MKIICMGLEIRINILKIKQLDSQISIKKNETERIIGQGKQS